MYVKNQGNNNRKHMMLLSNYVATWGLNVPPYHHLSSLHASLVLNKICKYATPNLSYLALSELAIIYPA